MHFTFYNSFDDSICYIPRYGDGYWSQLADLDEDNLRYLVEQLEATK